MNSIIEEIVEGLFAVCVTLGEYYSLYHYDVFLFLRAFTGTIPIIRCPRNNAAEMVAEVSLIK